MRQTIQEIKVNNAYRWFLGLSLHDTVPHFSTFGKNYTRRFKDTDLFERIFQKILSECMEAGLVDETVVFVDSTHVKARANSKKYLDEVAEGQVLWYEKELREEINRDREAHGKKPLKDEAPEAQQDDDEPSPRGGNGKPNPSTSKKKQARQKKEKHVKKSSSDPESGWFRKELHGFRYTQEYGKARLEVKAALTYACMNLKKLARKRWKSPEISSLLSRVLDFILAFPLSICVNPLSA